MEYLRDLSIEFEDFFIENQQNRVAAGANEQEQDCHSTAPALQPYSGSYKHQTNQPKTYEQEHSLAGASSLQLSLEAGICVGEALGTNPEIEDHGCLVDELGGRENQQNGLAGGAKEQVQDCHSIASALLPSSGGNATSVQFFNLLDGSHEHQTNRPMTCGVEQRQAGDSPLQLAIASHENNKQHMHMANMQSGTWVDNTGLHDHQSLPKRNENDNINQRKKISQKKSRDKKRQEAVETKENLEKANKEVERLKRELDGYVKSEENKHKEIVELRHKGFQMQENIQVLENKIEKLKGKNLKLKGKNDELLRQINSGMIGKSSSWRKITHGNWEFNINGSGVYLKLINSE